MNLDELISKYLDGEMTAQEDEILRNSLTADVTARLKFDSAVNLHLAMKEDAESVFPPEDLVAQTEEMILMKIFAKAPEPQRRRATIWSYAPLMAAMFAFFMFAFVFEISDLTQISINNQPLTVQNADNIKPLAESTNPKAVGIKIKAESVNAEIAVSSNEAGMSGVADGSNLMMVAAKVSEPIEEVVVNENSTGNASGGAIANENINIKPVPVNEDVKMAAMRPAMPVLAERIELHSNYLLNSANKINIHAPLPIEISDYYSHSDVQVASFLGTDFVQGGIDVNKAAISHFSQSIAYAVNDKERYGLEVGYTQYSYVDKGKVNVERKFGGTTGVESYEGGYGFSYGYSQDVALPTEKQLLWASAFYENTLVRVNGFSFVGRVGLGGTSDGPLGYGRVFAQYSLFEGFYLTLGTEGRMYSADFSQFDKNEDKLKLSASLIYGIQFKF